MSFLRIARDLFNKLKKQEDAETHQAPTSSKYETCNREEASLVGEGKCADCKGPLTEGPCGGGSINRYCLSPTCGSRFNEMGPFGVDRISDARPLAPKQTVQLNGPYK